MENNNYFKNHGRAYGIPSKPITAYNLTNGIVEQFPSVGEAAKAYDVNPVMISKIQKANRKAEFKGVYSSSAHTDKGVITFFEGELPEGDILMVSQVLYNEARISMPIIAVPQSPKTIGRILEAIDLTIEDIEKQYQPSVKNQTIEVNGEKYLLIRCLYNYTENKIQSLIY